MAKIKKAQQGKTLSALAKSPKNITSIPKKIKMFDKEEVRQKASDDAKTQSRLKSMMGEVKPIPSPAGKKKYVNYKDEEYSPKYKAGGKVKMKKGGRVTKKK